MDKNRSIAIVMNVEVSSDFQVGKPRFFLDIDSFVLCRVVSLNMLSSEATIVVHYLHYHFPIEPGTGQKTICCYRPNVRRTSTKVRSYVKPSYVT